MNNLSYQLYIKNFLNNYTVNFNLSTQNEKQKLSELEQQFLNNTHLQVDVMLGQGIGKLVDKPNLLDEFYYRIKQNLSSVMNYIKDTYGLGTISAFTFNNQDCLLNIEDTIFSIIKDLKYLNDLNIYSRKEFSSYQFNQLLSSICNERQSLEELTFQFNVKDDLTNIQIPNQLSYIKKLCLTNLNLQNQLSVFQVAKQISEVKIQLDSKLKINKLIDELLIKKNFLQKLQLEIDINQQIKEENCLKSIERLHDLRYLHLRAVNLKNQDIDIQKLKYLESLSLNFSDAIDFLSNKFNLSQLTSLEIDIGLCDAKQLNLKQMKNLRVLNLNFKQTQEKETIKTISCLEKFSEITNQLSQLKLNFSQSRYFQMNIISSNVIQCIGLIFEKCNENTFINLITHGCLFNTAKRFELSLQIMKIKNQEKFQLNDCCIYDSLKGNSIISSQDLNVKFPYFLAVSSQNQNINDITVELDWKYFTQNYSVIKGQNILFSKFKNFSMSNGHRNRNISKESEQFVSFLPEEVTYIKIPQYFKMKSIIKNSKYLKKLQIIQFEESLIDLLINKEFDVLELKQNFNQNLHLKFTNQLSNFSNYKKLYEKVFDLEGYIIEMKLNCYFKDEDIIYLSKLILNEKNIIYLNLIYKQEKNKKFIDLIKTYSDYALNQVLAINAFNNYLIENINLNPKFVYLDLYF